ncbi:MAG TPA: glycosyltransferase family 2 protein [Candidatus Saccharimonadales bacterium]|nr:glycosyltransferase family 2 protein [Candidatus Saccharimonadales bacterium]
MKSIEIPYENERSKKYRFFEILPGALSWSLLALPLVLSLIDVRIAAFFILAYILIYFTRAMAVSVRALVGYQRMREHEKLDWNQLIGEVQTGEVAPQAVRPKWHYANLARVRAKRPVVTPDEIVHAVIIATYNESKEVLEPTIQALINADYDVKKKVVLFLAYEERGGDHIEKQALELVAKYKHAFRYAQAVKHPNGVTGEIKGKGSNLTYAGRAVQKYVEAKAINPVHVSVTTLDADNRPDKKYFSALTYLYCVSPDPTRASYQPLPMFTSNIWDAPAPMRVIATGNNFFYIVLTQRPHLERNFSAHAQSLRALIDMNFWSMRTIVEDGHQFWRSYFHFDGDYRVYPILIPVYCDAVLSDTYIKTLRAQFIQLRRWTYGASDVAYIANQGFLKKNKIPKGDLISKFLRLLEGHVSWASGALLLAFAAFIPALLNPGTHEVAAYELPIIVSRVQTIGLIGVLASLFVALKTLPPRPLRYKRHRTVFMLLQWLYLPITNIAYGSLAALNSQTRLMFKWYLTKFDVTDKSVKK